MTPELKDARFLLGWAKGKTISNVNGTNFWKAGAWMTKLEPERVTAMVAAGYAMVEGSRLTLAKKAIAAGEKALEKPKAPVKGRRKALDPSLSSALQKAAMDRLLDEADAREDGPSDAVIAWLRALAEELTTAS